MPRPPLLALLLALAGGAAPAGEAVAVPTAPADTAAAATDTVTTAGEELIVTAPPVERPAGLQSGDLSLGADQLGAVPGLVEPDPLRALQGLPGVAAASDLSSGLFIRGAGPDQALVLMDGAPVYNPTHAFGLFSTFNGDAVAGVDLYKGAPPARHGGRLGAVLDVRMREGRGDRTRARLGLSLIAARAAVEGRRGDDRWLLAGRRTYLEPVLAAARSEENPIPGYFFYDLNGRYGTGRLGGWTTLTVYHGRDQVALDATEDTQLDLVWGNTVAALRHARALGRSVDLTLRLHASHYTSDTDGQVLATPAVLTNALTDLTAAGRLDWWAGGGHQVSLGASASRYDVSYDQSFNREQQIAYGTRPVELVAFLADRWQASDATTLRAGLRLRHLDDGDRLLLEPRLAASHRLDDRWRLTLGLGRGHQYLQLVTTEGFTATDFYLPIDATADIGRSWQVTAGVQWEPTARDRLSLEVYDVGLDDLVVLDQRTAADRTAFTAEGVFVTGGEGWARGVELLWRRDLGPVTGWLGYTLGWTRRRFDELNGGAEFPPRYDRRHDLDAVTTWRTGAWTLGARFRYGTGQAFTPASARYLLRDPGSGSPDAIGQLLPAARNSARLRPYHRLDLSARRPISLLGRPAELVLEVFNVYSRRNEWFVQYEADGPVTEATVVRMLPIIPSLGVTLEF